MSLFDINQWVMTTNPEWIGRGFTHPKRIYAIRNDCALLCNNFTDCHFSNLRLATEQEIAITPNKHICKYKITRVSNRRLLTSIQFSFEYVFVEYFLN